MEESNNQIEPIQSPTFSETIERNVEEDDVNVLSGDNKVDVDIEPDVKSNDVYLQLCSCSLVFNCFSNNSD
jgi:hypothetical protein